MEHSGELGRGMEASRRDVHSLLFCSTLGVSAWNLLYADNLKCVGNHADAMLAAARISNKVHRRCRASCCSHQVRTAQYL